MTTRSEALLSDLLAVIHRDGGHHTYRVGLDESVRHAITRIQLLIQDNDEYQTTFRLLEQRLSATERELEQLRRAGAKHAHTNKDASENLAG